MRALLIAMLVLVAAGCSAPQSDALDVLDALPQSPSATTTTAAEATTSSLLQCEANDWATASLRPAGITGPSVEALRRTGRIRIGVDESTLGFSARDPETGDLEGFEIDLARAVAERLAGDGVVVTFVPVDTRQKLALVRDGAVDLSISANSMSCDRWEDVAFSAEYFTANQVFLTRRDHPLEDLEDVASSRICMTTASSSARMLTRLVPAAEQVLRPTRADCLVALQLGEADAYFGHDSFVVGMLEQDPTLDLVPGLLPAAETVSHYGIAVNRDRPDLAMAVNAALADIVADGTWAELHDRLAATLPAIPPAEPPTPRYRD